MLLESLFNPDATNPLNTVISFEDPKYCEMRAIELVQDACSFLLNHKKHSSEEAALEAYHTNIKQAISLLVIARCLRNESLNT